MTTADVNKKVIKQLVVTHDGKTDLSDYLAEQLQLVEEIRQSVRRLYKERQEAERRHTEELDAIAKQLAEVHKRCGHPSRTHHPDPAGGSDSWTECDVCGASVG